MVPGRKRPVGWATVGSAGAEQDDGWHAGRRADPLAALCMPTAEAGRRGCSLILLRESDRNGRGPRQAAGELPKYDLPEGYRVPEL